MRLQRNGGTESQKIPITSPSALSVTGSIESCNLSKRVWYFEAGSGAELVAIAGAALCDALEKRGVRYFAAVRRQSASGQFETGDIAGPVDWSSALAGCDTVIHLAGRVHMMRDASTDPLAAYRAVNADATLHLARQAAEQGVRRFIFQSSVKVNGENSPAGRPFSAQDCAAPQDPYGVSKLEAEQRLKE